MWWLQHPLPLFGLLERISLEAVVVVDALEDYLGLGASESLRQKMVPAPRHVGDALGRPVRQYTATVLPFRDFESDSIRQARLPSCWKFDFMQAIRQSANVAEPRKEPLLIVDVGAGLGDCVLWALTVFGPSLFRAIAFEPVPWVAARLRRSVQINGLSSAIQVVEVALGPPCESQHVTLHGEVNHGLTNLYVDGIAGADVGHTKVNVRYSTLDKELERLETIGGLIKPYAPIEILVCGVNSNSQRGMDVAAGATSTLKRVRHAIMCPTLSLSGSVA